MILKYIMFTIYKSTRMSKAYIPVWFQLLVLLATSISMAFTVITSYMLKIIGMGHWDVVKMLAQPWRALRHTANTRSWSKWLEGVSHCYLLRYTMSSALKWVKMEWLAISSLLIECKFMIHSIYHVQSVQLSEVFRWQISAVAFLTKGFLFGIQFHWCLLQCVHYSLFFANRQGVRKNSNWECSTL